MLGEPFTDDNVFVCDESRRRSGNVLLHGASAHSMKDCNYEATGRHWRTYIRCHQQEDCEFSGTAETAGNCRVCIARSTASSWRCSIVLQALRRAQRNQIAVRVFQSTIHSELPILVIIEDEFDVYITHPTWSMQAPNKSTRRIITMACTDTFIKFAKNVTIQSDIILRVQQTKRHVSIINGCWVIAKIYAK